MDDLRCDSFTYGKNSIIWSPRLCGDLRDDEALELTRFLELLQGVKLKLEEENVVRWMMALQPDFSNFIPPKIHRKNFAYLKSNAFRPIKPPAK
ncbi:hypothetical protein QJS04_geneDACA022914 [Acorus gramineus]|uniref:Uncharacterized protein n=1 Tax=Acorus gramineus TaxID=55184 RepID=A0AAV9A0T9_ACOGR|nr:hypothetical protein QJS04_geneDACA022914 [Acorus gramineus]